MKTYTTIQGDMWDSIAYKQLGSTAYTDKLQTLNARYLGYYTFPAGITLRLPDITTAMPSTLPPWRVVSG